MLSTDTGAVGTMTCGCMKADDNDEGANVRTHESHEAGDRQGSAVLGPHDLIEYNRVVVWAHASTMDRAGPM